MADGFSPLHQLRGLAEIGVRTGGIDHCTDLTLANDRAGKYCFAGFARRRQQLSGQRGLIDLHRVAVQQARVCRHDVAEAHADDVARHQLARGRVDPLPVAYNPGLDRQRRLQCGDGVPRLVFFPEAYKSVGHKQNEDDAEIRPVPGHRRQDDRRFDHPRDRTPKIVEKFQQLIGLLFLNLVGPILSKAFFCLRLAQAIRRRPQFFSTSASGRVFKSSFTLGFNLGFDMEEALGWSASGFSAVAADALRFFMRVSIMGAVSRALMRASDVSGTAVCWTTGISRQAGVRRQDEPCTSA